MDIFIPVRLKVWQAGEPIVNRIKTANGNEISNIEIPESEGRDVFAIEDGYLSVDEWAAKNNAAELVSDNEDRIWNYRHFVASKTGPVKAGERIGRAKGGDLILGVMDEESETEDVGPNQMIRLSRQPLEVLDELNVLPLPQDVEPDDIDTEDERHALSDQLIQGRGKKVDLVKVALYAAGVGLAAYGAYKIIK